jgi:hypothetical protein
MNSLERECLPLRNWQFWDSDQQRVRKRGEEGKEEQILECAHLLQVFVSQQDSTPASLISSQNTVPTFSFSISVTAQDL